MPATPHLGEIAIFAFNFPPKGWALCSGQILPIAQNQALFALLGTTYGGNGITTFGLPDLRGRAAVSSGQGPGLSNYSLGSQTGEASHTLVISEMPAHSHPANCNSGAGSFAEPGGHVWAADGTNVTKAYAPPPTTLQAMAPGIAPNAGGNAHENQQPFLAVEYCIALTGIFPSRN